MPALFCKWQPRLAILFLLIPTLVFGQTLNDDPWKNVIHAQKGREFPYTVVSRDFGCADSTLVAATDRTMTLKGKDGRKLTISRADVLQFRQERLKPSAIVYSGRSSWLDVTEVRHDRFYSEKMLVILRDGKRRQGTLSEVQDSSLTLVKDQKDRQNPIRLEKNDIAEVYRVTFKRMSPDAEYIYEELPFFWVLDPATWPAIVDRGIFVLLYRAESKEDNAAAVCSREL
jgi:hypothetical protein